MPSSKGACSTVLSNRKRTVEASTEVYSVEAKRTRKYPAFSLNNLVVVKKLQAIIDLVAMSIFALPFIKGKDSGKDQRPRSISDIEEKLRRHVYKNTSEVFDDMDYVFDLRNEGNHDIAFTVLDEKRIRRATLDNRQVDVMAGEMRRSLTGWIEEMFADISIEDRPVATKIHTALEKRFPHVPSKHLKMAACEVSQSKEDIWKRIVRDLNQVNENLRPDALYQKFRFTPSQQHDFGQEHIVHKYIAGYQFHKMVMKWSDPAVPFPIPLRKVANPEDAIAHIDYIRNTKLEEEYNAQKDKFMRENKDASEVLLFHGTAVSCVDSILKNNFSVNHTPVQQNNQKEVRGKKMMFGAGIYFSEMPSISLMYGNGLVLCKVLLGDCETYRPSPASVQPEIPETCDSREVVTRDGSGVIHVVRRPQQILPYCVIQLKSESLSSDYRKPSLAPGLVSPTAVTSALAQVVTCSPPAPVNIIPPAPVTSLPPAPVTSLSPAPTPSSVIVAVAPDQASSLGLATDLTASQGLVTDGAWSDESREEQAEKTLRTFTCPVKPSIRMTILNPESDHPVISAPEMDPCSVCLDPLSEAVVVLPCGHSLHQQCARQLVLQGSAGPLCLQCPQCQAQHGTRTGTQPRGGTMAWLTTGTSLPGHDGTGTIAITYSIPAGVQGEEHPHPGQPYHTPGFPRTAFLPATREGRQVLDLLATAFSRRLLFTVGRSLSLGQEDCVTWAEVHHKTQQQGQVYGFPDPGYLARVRQELAEKGVVGQGGGASVIKDGSRTEKHGATKVVHEEQASMEANTSGNNPNSVREGVEGNNGFVISQSPICVA